MMYTLKNTAMILVCSLLGAVIGWYMSTVPAVATVAGVVAGIHYLPKVVDYLHRKLGV